MTQKAILAKLDALLEPLDFMRTRAAWNRRSECFIEVIDVQVSKAGDAATVNAGVLDTTAHVKLWGSEPPEFVEETACTVRARVGELIDGKDLWWPVEGDHAIDQVSKAVCVHVLPFVERMCSRESMVQWLIDTQVVKKKYPPSIINLAILQSLVGRSSEACALLAEMQTKAVGAWRAKAAEVAVRLGCAK